MPCHQIFHMFVFVLDLFRVSLVRNCPEHCLLCIHTNPFRSEESFFQILAFCLFIVHKKRKRKTKHTRIKLNFCILYDDRTINLLYKNTTNSVDIEHCRDGKCDIYLCSVSDFRELITCAHKQKKKQHDSTLRGQYRFDRNKCQWHNTNCSER